MLLQPFVKYTPAKQQGRSCAPSLLPPVKWSCALLPGKILLPAAAAIETAATDLGSSGLPAADLTAADVNGQTTGKENKRKKKSKKVKGEKDD